MLGLHEGCVEVVSYIRFSMSISFRYPSDCVIELWMIRDVQGYAGCVRVCMVAL